MGVGCSGTVWIGEGWGRRKSVSPSPEGHGFPAVGQRDPHDGQRLQGGVEEGAEGEHSSVRGGH